MNRSPMNYTGGKYKLLPQILPLFPDDIRTFVDLFCGGCNVGINVQAKSHIYTDSCKPLIDLYNTMRNLNEQAFLDCIYKIIDNYELSLSSVNGYGYYGCESSAGLGKYNKPHYLNLRMDFNSNTHHDEYYFVMFYVLIVYAFNNQIRFNSNGEFNLPVGKRDFNKKMEAKLLDYVNVIKAQDSNFDAIDFRTFDFNRLKKGDFVYADPPYLITCAAYNEQGGWTEKEELDLLNILDMLDSNGIRFALSNVMEAKGRQNTFLYDWVSKHKNYKVKDLNYSYKNSNYQRKQKNSGTREVLIINY